MSAIPSEHTSAPFARSAPYYDLIFQKKNFSAEAAAVAKHLEITPGIQVRPSRRLLDFGCGTGRHLAHWISHGWSAIGIEPCPEMAAIATAKGLHVRPGDICSDARDAQPIAGAAVCMFGAFSYACTDGDKLRAALRNVRFHLSAGSRFVFDVVNLACAAGGLRGGSLDSFAVRKNEFLIRHLEKRLDPMGSLVMCDLSYSLIEYSGETVEIHRIDELTGERTDEVVGSLMVPPKDGAKESWTEHHVMRAFSPPELRYALDTADFNVVSILDPETGGEVRADSYYFQVVAEAC